MKAKESVVDYINRVVELQYNLDEVDERLSERFLCQSFLKSKQKSSILLYFN